MARLARLEAPGLPQLVQWRSVAGSPTCHDAQDQATLMQAFQRAVQETAIAIHAYTFGPEQVLLLATPTEQAQLGHCVQSVGRRYVSAYNLRHGRHGALWSGRYHCCVLEPGAWLLNGLVWVDSLSQDQWLNSAFSRLGRSGPPTLTLPLVQVPAYWQLGNTPFERELNYAKLLAEGLPKPVTQKLESALRGGWPVGTVPLDQDSSLLLRARPAQPRPRGRPKLQRQSL